MTVYATPEPRDLATLLAGTHRRLVRCRILNGDYAGTDLPVVDGRLSWVYDDPVRLSGGLTVAAVAPWDATTAGAALSPLIGPELLLSAGVIDDDDDEHWWDYGVVRVTQRTVRATADRIEVDIEVRDRGAIIAQAGASRSWIIPRGMGILAGVQSAILNVAPWAALSLPLADDMPASSDITLVEKAGEDVWEASRALVRAMGRLLTVDTTGTVTADMILLPQATDPISVPLTGWETSEDGARLVHQVAASWVEPRPDGAANDWVPDAGTEIVRDPDSMSLPDHMSVITAPYRGDASVLGSAVMARAAATAQLADSLDLVVSGSCESVPHPDLTPGSVIERDGWRHRVTGLDISLSGGATRVALGARWRDGLAVTLREVLKPRTGSERDEIVTSVSPLMSRAITEPGGGSRLVEPTDATRGVAVGDPIRVRTDGAGRRVAVALGVPKTIVQKHAGETLGTVGGASLTVNGSATLRARVVSSGSPGSYATFSGGDVSIPGPDTSNMAEKDDLWRLYSYGISASAVGAAPTSWTQAWGNSVVSLINEIRTGLNTARSVYWYSG